MFILIYNYIHIHIVPTTDNIWIQGEKMMDRRSTLILFASTCWQQHLLFLPWIFSGLSIMKLPFHTTEKSTGSSLIFIPSYRYYRRRKKKEKRRQRMGGGCKKRGGFQWEVWEFADPRIPYGCRTMSFQSYPAVTSRRYQRADKVGRNKNWDSWAEAWTSLLAFGDGVLNCLPCP